MLINREKFDQVNYLWSLHPDTFLNTEEAALLLNQSPNTLKKWRHERIGPNYKRGRPVLYTIANLKAYSEKQNSNYG